MVSTRSFRGVRTIQFGEFALDVRAAELRKDGARVKLQEQPFRILVMLLEHPGEVVLREDIRRRLWPNGTIVEVGHGINAAVLRLREALGDSADAPRYVETVARRGYRFAGQVDLVHKERVETAAAEAESGTPGDARQALAGVLDTSDLEGRTISHYRVIEKVGAGGMGVVYRAEDLKLGRHVALKFLPTDMAGDPVAIGRFQREARVASTLNHPNICTVYGVEEYGGQPLIVMEMLEGETLEARLGKGALPAARSLTLAIQMADALDAAHRRGIIHRDLKPANIVLTRGGVKVLDFGLAKIARPVAMGENHAHVTQEGAILGTLHYMSPEQVQGKETGAPSDIFSFGLVLYEMLAGRRAFPGENSATVMAAILTWDPPEIRESAGPAGLDRILRRCLAKDPEERWQSACDLKAALEWIAAGWTPGQAAASALPGEAVLVPSPDRVPVEVETSGVVRRWPRAATWILRVALAVVVLAVGASAVLHRWDVPWQGPAMSEALVAGTETRPGPAKTPAVERSGVAVRPQVQMPPVGLGITPAGSRAITRFTVWPPGDGNVTRLSLSPDGRSVAFLSGGRILVRAFDSLEMRTLDGTDGAGSPFWSPDGRSIAFTSRGELKTIRVDGGLPVTLCKVNTTMRGVWSADGTILIGLVGHGIFRVSTATGALSPVTRLDDSKHETRHLLPQFLPDGRRFLYIAGAGQLERSTLYAGSLDSAERTPIMEVSSSVELVTPRAGSSSAYLIYTSDRTLMAQAFDLTKLRTKGEAVAIAGPIPSVTAIGADLGVGDFSAMGNTLAYRSAGVPNGRTMKDVGNIVVVQNWVEEAAVGRKLLDAEARRHGDRTEKREKPVPSR